MRRARRRPSEAKTPFWPSPREPAPLPLLQAETTAEAAQSILENCLELLGM